MNDRVGNTQIWTVQGDKTSSKRSYSFNPYTGDVTKARHGYAREVSLTSTELVFQAVFVGRSAKRIANHETSTKLAMGTHLKCTAQALAQFAVVPQPPHASSRNPLVIDGSGRARCRICERRQRPDRTVHKRLSNIKLLQAQSQEAQGSPGLSLHTSDCRQQETQHGRAIHLPL